MVVLAVLLPVVFGALLLLGLPRALGVLGAGLSFLLNLYLFLTHPGGVAHAFQAPPVSYTHLTLPTILLV